MADKSARERLFGTPEHRIMIHEARVNIVFWRNGAACTSMEQWTHANFEEWGRTSGFTITPSHSVGLLNPQQVAINTVVGIVELLITASERGRALQNEAIRKMLGVSDGR